jgi:exopolyphosphatase/guanosine-5'-triphosphate,3'-diphosphate pyrophosphatase
LVVDIGGGSTEFVIGAGYKPLKLDSLFMGCVSHSVRFFPDGKISKGAMKQAEIEARAELQPMVAKFSRGNWQEAVGSSGTVRAISDILKLNGFDDAPITPRGLERLRAHLIKAGDMGKVDLAALRPDRVPVLPGGLAILSAVLCELEIETMVVAEGAMREGMLYDMLGRIHRRDMRDVTVAQFMQRYHVDAAQARRVAAVALKLYDGLAGEDADEMAPQYIVWAAKLHEIGISVAYSGYHRHSAYILGNADMPGFSRDEQTRLAALVLAHRRSMKKLPERVDDGNIDWNAVFTLRLAVLICRGRMDIALPPLQVKAQGRRFRLNLDTEWLVRNPLTATALREEAREWDKIGFELRVPGLDGLESSAELALTS